MARKQRLYLIIESKKDDREFWEQRLYIYKTGKEEYKALVYEIVTNKYVPLKKHSIDGRDFTGFISVWNLKTGFVRAARFENNQVIETGVVEVIDYTKRNSTNKAPVEAPCVYADFGDGGCGGKSGGGDNTPPKLEGIVLREVVVQAPSTGSPVEYYGPRNPEIGGPTTGGYTSPNGGGANTGGGGITAPTPEKIFNELTGKAKCMYDKLMVSGLFSTAVKKFDGDFAVSHLKLTINNNLDTNVFAITVPPVNYITEIQFDNTKLANLSDLGNATVFAHEIIHAEIFRKMLSAAQNGSLDPQTMTPQQQIAYVNSLKNNYPGLMDYYYNRTHPTWNHDMMASHYRGTIADIIQQFDNNRLPRSTYEAVTWFGLGKLGDGQKTVAWTNLSSVQQTTILNLIGQNAYQGPSTCN
ncbi:hypothetical protein [Flavobacterium sp. 2]|uniref:hypothetical protein n=1 Tax=Flavobacterium sp. 2 TaxID=308053 RepID=UPI003CF632B8